LKLGNFGPKPGNLFAKNLEMLHNLRIAFIKVQRRFEYFTRHDQH
jgi:hypothetical protein